MNLKPSIAVIFEDFTKNADMLVYVRANPSLFIDLIGASLDTKHPKAWRAAMLLGHAMKKNDARVTPYIDSFIEHLPLLKHDGHQRQSLIILDKLTLNEAQNGHLFNHCLSFWEQVNKIPSTRIRSFQAMVKMAADFPELKTELKLFTTDYYTQTLSAGIKVSFQRLVAKSL